jgi:hypothetical protein
LALLPTHPEVQAELALLEAMDHMARFAPGGRALPLGPDGQPLLPYHVRTIPRQSEPCLYPCVADGLEGWMDGCVRGLQVRRLTRRLDLLERLVQSSPDAYTNWGLLRRLAELTKAGSGPAVEARRTQAHG